MTLGKGLVGTLLLILVVVVAIYVADWLKKQKV